MAESEKNLMPKSVWNAIVLVASVVAGTLFVESKIEDTIKNTIEPIVNRLDKLETSFVEYSKNQALNTYKIQAIEQYGKEFLKPNEVEIKHKQP